MSSRAQNGKDPMEISDVFQHNFYMAMKCKIRIHTAHSGKYTFSNPSSISKD
jgi:hypothetical protein